MHNSNLADLVKLRGAKLTLCLSQLLTQIAVRILKPSLSYLEIAQFSTWKLRGFAHWMSGAAKLEKLATTTKLVLYSTHGGF